MADGFSVEMKGLKEVDEKLALLGAVAGEKVMRSTIFAAVKPIQEAAQSNISAIPGGSGALSKATRRVYLKSGGGGISRLFSTGSRFVAAVAPKTKDRVAIALAGLHYKKKIRGVFWGHLVEWGHRIGNRSTGRLTRATSFRGSSGLGKVQGRLVFTRALNSRSSESIELFRKLIFRAVDRALKRQKVA